MSKVKQTVYLITEQQHEALLNYLLNRPYREVAGGVKFLTNAPTAVLNVEVPPEEQSASMPAEEESKLDAAQEKVTSPTEELAVLSVA